MVFIKTDNKDRVVFVSTTSTSDDMILVEDIPNVPFIEGKSYNLYWSNEKGFWYEYIDNPIIPETNATNEEIRVLREFSYKTESDSLFIAYNKYLILGDIDKAEFVKQEWINKINEINSRYPYL